MKKLMGILLAVVILAGCRGSGEGVDMPVALRNAVCARGCSFLLHITADYGQEAYTFSMDCRAEPDGTVTFSVTEPDSISGISGIFQSDQGKLTFDDQALAFTPLTDGQLTPVSAPWLLIKTIRGGYIKSAGSSGEGYVFQIDDSYMEQALHLDIYTDAKGTPIAADYLWKDHRIISVRVENFAFL